MGGARGTAFLLLALANLFWAGNWVIGRLLRDAFQPATLNFWRWALAALVLAPFALPAVLRHRAEIRRHAGVLLLLAATGIALFQSLVYLGLQTTTTVNGVLLNSSAPLFIVLCAWLIERERVGLREVAGMLLSFAGILVILSRGEPARLLELRFQAGDAWVLLAMPVWGVYSVLLRRRPAALGGVALVFVLAVLGTLLLAPFAALEALAAPPAWPGTGPALGVAYVALAASIGAFLCWNRGVALAGPSFAGFTLHLLPAFGTLLAIAFLGERFHAFHAAGIATILAGVLLATRPR